MYHDYVLAQENIESLANDESDDVDDRLTWLEELSADIQNYINELIGQQE